MNEVIFLNNKIKDFFAGKDPFECAKNIDGTIFRDLDNRVTKEFFLDGELYFIKMHLGIGWSEILKNLLQLKKPAYGAYDEWMALIKLKEIGINCPEPLAFGRKGNNPSKLESFIITKSLINTSSLEEITLSWKLSPPSKGLKDLLVKNVASLSRKLHLNGMNHRDLYLCHFHVENDGTHNIIYLIDLHRAQIRNSIPNRWRVKDIGGLLHSAINLGFSEKDFYRFFMIYFNCSLKELFLYHRRFIRLSSLRAFKMFMKPRTDKRINRALLNFKNYKKLARALKNLNKDI
ncbi:MAG: lipopolysaccharide core heptose(I) kinase RfaP [SAR86 cluster bacterium]|nr:lipopolysaccharide core heptose(I) kinase RfaP [SAR86 cluster bacterium]